MSFSVGRTSVTSAPGLHTTDKDESVGGAYEPSDCGLHTVQGQTAVGCTIVTSAPWLHAAYTGTSVGNAHELSA